MENIKFYSALTSEFK